MDKKIAVTLIFSLAAILAAILFSYAFVFSLANPMIVLVMHLLVAVAFTMIFKKPRIDKTLLTIGILVMLLIPLGYAYMVISPMLVSSLAMMYVLMHFVFAFGVVTIVTQWAKIKKLV